MKTPHNNLVQWTRRGSFGLYG